NWEEEKGEGREGVCDSIIKSHILTFPPSPFLPISQRALTAPPCGLPCSI
ncbi:unnamed protein product, partial [Candidula unifasciata]